MILNGYDDIINESWGSNKISLNVKKIFLRYFNKISKIKY